MTVDERAIQRDFRKDGEQREKYFMSCQCAVDMLNPPIIVTKKQGYARVKSLKIFSYIDSKEERELLDAINRAHLLTTHFDLYEVFKRIGPEKVDPYPYKIKRIENEHLEDYYCIFNDKRIVSRRRIRNLYDLLADINDLVRFDNLGLLEAVELMRLMVEDGMPKGCLDGVRCEPKLVPALKWKIDEEIHVDRRMRLSTWELSRMLFLRIVHLFRRK